LAIIQSGISIVMGNGNGTWRAGASVPVLTGGTEILSADLNRDGILDLVNNACCGQTRTTYLLGYGNGTFAPEEVLAAPLDPAPAAIADINGDTWPEIALGGTDGSFTINYPSLTNLYIVNSASGKLRVTPDSIASAYGIRLATQANPAGTTVTVKDSAGTTRNSFVYYSSPGFLNFTIPAGTALGESTVTVTSADGTRSSTKVNTTTVIPGLYVLNLNGLVAANVLRVNASGSTYEDLFQLSNGAIVPKAINLGPPTDEIFLLLYGTGIRAAGKAGTSVTIGGIPVTVDYSGPQGAPGFDQVNIKLPRTLIGKGATELVLTANGEVANTVTLTIQ
jgi:uncharacterized protein (TIGR03437 family)